MIHVFERPLIGNTIYPCTVGQISDRLSDFPDEDLEGLWAVGLVPSTKKENKANGRYVREPRPCIHLLSWPADLSVKLDQGDDFKTAIAYSAVERSYGLEVSLQGSRVVYKWHVEDLEQFILRHVLAHEIGHHVLAKERLKMGLSPRAPRTVSEQFAEHYAFRHL